MSVDATGHAPSSVVVFAHRGSLTGFPTAIGELLVDIGSPAVFALTAPHSGGLTPLSGTVPLSPALCGTTLFAQALILGAPGPQLTNGLELTVGD